LQRAQRPAHAHRRDLVPEPQRGPAQQPADQMQRRPPRRRRQPAAASIAIDDLDVEPIVEGDVALGANRLQERERLVIAPEDRVLAVIDDLAGRRVRKRRRTPAEASPLLDHEDPGAALDQAHGRAQPGKAGADDDDVRPGHEGQAECAARCRWPAWPAVPW
jgi:hypothetical protein